MIDDIWTSGKKYRVIYADPPWTFGCWNMENSNRGAHFHYDVMDNTDIAKMPVGELAEKDALIFLWCTKPLLPQQIKIMEDWGFQYTTVGFTWIKLNKKSMTPFIGLGYYTRANPEYCLIGKKGKGLGQPKRRDIEEVVMAPIREHSRKPDVIRDNIALMYDGPRIELFSRTKYPGWDCFGNQTDKFETNNNDIFNDFSEENTQP